MDSKLDLDIGTPQGSVLSPLMANIYFNKLDSYITENIIPLGKGMDKGKRNQTYYDATSPYRGNKWEEVLQKATELTPNVGPRTRRGILKKLRVEEAKALGIPYYDRSTGPGPISKIKYIRYADDFVIGIAGNKKQCFKILQEIFYYCEHDLKMKLNASKSGLKHRSEGTLFLGYRIFLGDRTIETGGKALQQRRTRTRMKFQIPVKRLYERYEARGFLQKAKKGNKGKYVPRRCDKLLFGSPLMIISRYKAIFNGLINYYRGSERLSDLYNFLYVLRRSAALTLAHHHRERTAI